METKPTETPKVDAYMAQFEHPLKKVMERLREIILQADPQLGEEVKWNAPTFFYTGPMAPADPKEYKRYLIVSNVHSTAFIMLVWLNGARVDDGSGFLEGKYADGRRLLRFHNLDEVEASKTQLQGLVKQWLKMLDKN